MSNDTTSQSNTDKNLLRNRLKRKIQSISSANRQRLAVRRTHSPKNAPYIFPPTELGKALLEGNTSRNSVRVQLLPPTVEGIVEAAKSSIVAFPSETVYLLGCRAHDTEAIRKLLLLMEQREGNSKSVLNQGDLLDLNYNSKVPSFANPPIVCISSILQAKGFINFGAAKLYSLVTPRQPNSVSVSTSNTTQTLCCNNAVDKSALNSSSSMSTTMTEKKQIFIAKFVEGKVVLNRLMSNFWPGPFVIFVPASSMLPSEILIKITATSYGGKTYVGLGCPSHPLARRLLKTSKRPLVTFSVASGSATTASSYDDACSSAVGIQTALQSCSSNIANLVIPCINGEDRQEAFAVPTCELGTLSTAVLIQEETRQIHILRNANKITPNDIKNALLRKCNDSPDTEQRNKMLRAVLMKWNVVSYGDYVE